MAQTASASTPNTLQDKVITCSDCRKGFTWTADQQKFYREKQLSAPKRCKTCRDQRKATEGR